MAQTVTGSGPQLAIQVGLFFFLFFFCCLLDLETIVFLLDCSQALTSDDCGELEICDWSTYLNTCFEDVSRQSVSIPCPFEYDTSSEFCGIYYVCDTTRTGFLLLLFFFLSSSFPFCSVPAYNKTACTLLTQYYCCGEGLTHADPYCSLQQAAGTLHCLDLCPDLNPVGNCPPDFYGLFQENRGRKRSSWSTAVKLFISENKKAHFEFFFFFSLFLGISFTHSLALPQYGRFWGLSPLLGRPVAISLQGLFHITLIKQSKRSQQANKIKYLDSIVDFVFTGLNAGGFARFQYTLDEQLGLSPATPGTCTFPQNSYGPSLNPVTKSTCEEPNSICSVDSNCVVGANYQCVPTCVLEAGGPNCPTVGQCNFFCTGPGICAALSSDECSLVSACSTSYVCLPSKKSRETTRLFHFVQIVQIDMFN